MIKLFNPIICTIVFCILALTASCKKENIVVDYGCGEVETQIAELDHSIGAYIDSVFSNSPSLNFEEAAIVINIEDININNDSEFGCFEYTPIPQVIDKISITSSNSVNSGGIEYAPGEDLNELFKLHNQQQTYSISEFIIAQREEPLLFHSEGDAIVLQLLDQPDALINQSFVIKIIFDDLRILNEEIPTFEVTN